MNGLRSAAELAANKPHGTRIKYKGGCHCLKCRMANSNYETSRARARKAGESNGLVSTADVRAHLLKLSKQGLGYKTVADAASVARSTVAKIRYGERRQIRVLAAKRILAVTEAARADHSFVSAKALWRRIHHLLEEGFTRAELAHRLGYARKYQFRRDRVLASSDLKVERLYRRLTQ